MAAPRMFPWLGQWGDGQPYEAPHDEGTCPSCGDELAGPRCGTTCAYLHCRWCGHVERVVEVGGVA